MFGRKKEDKGDEQQPKDFAESIKSFSEKHRQESEEARIQRLKDMGAFKLPNSDEIHRMIASIAMFESANDDPEDCLFLSLTQREVVLLALTLNLFRNTASKHEFFRNMIECLNQLQDKIAESMKAQKAPHLLEEEN
jgi:hypothetical protein